MTEQINSWESTWRAKFYSNLLIHRYPQASDPNNKLASLATDYGAEPVVGVLDAIEGFETPLPTLHDLGLLATATFYRKLSKAGLGGASEIQ